MQMYQEEAKVKKRNYHKRQYFLKKNQPSKVKKRGYENQ